MRLICKYCREPKTVRPSDIKDINNYYCNNGLCKSFRLKKALAKKRGIIMEDKKIETFGKKCQQIWKNLEEKHV